MRRASLELVAASFMVLFQELALIRWLPGQVRVIAYFPNLILISAFLGLGMGCLRAGQRSLLWLWPVSLTILFGAFYALSHVIFTQNPISEYLWLLYLDMPKNSPVIHGVRLPLVLAFSLSTLSFVSLGQLVAERIHFFAERSNALWGYAWDITGSLLGVIAFAAVSFLGVFPLGWFSIIAASGLVFFLPHRRLLLIYVPALLIGLGLVGLAERASYYSPYYALDTDRDPASAGAAGFFVTTNGSYHQRAVGLRQVDQVAQPWHQTLKWSYHLPYQKLTEKPKRVLVLGAGTGNDVAVALDEGAGSIDAVEIDPLILELGRRYHPDHPYDSPRVRLFNTDARSFLNSCENEYDLIVFGTLDSMTRLSALSSVRLDNFVYTLEGMRAARRCLKPEGGMVLYFSVAKRYIEEHIIGMLADAFNELPVMYKGRFILFTRIFLIGPAFAHLKKNNEVDAKVFFDKVLPNIQIPTDDWPYLYLRDRGLSWFYISLMAIFAALAVAGVFLVSRSMRASLMRNGRVDLEMFLFGLAFLLLETKFVTGMNLVWGATWLTSAVVFGSILTVILLATVVMKLKPMPWWVALAGLLLTLLATYCVPVAALLDHHPFVKLALSFLFVGGPVFFASACFALRFRMRARADLAFGWNLLGAVAGGLLEFFSMALGLRALALLAIAAYLAVALLRQRALRKIPAV
jgi:spermidine synthase